MKKYLYILLLFFICLTSTGCEEILSMPDSEADNLVINAIASPSETLAVDMSLTRSIDSGTPQYGHIDYYDYYMSVDSAYYKQFVVKTADVSFSVNGGERKGTMHYDEKKYKYISDYQPKPGDNITINAEYIDAHGKTHKAYGSVDIPAKQPEFEILSRYTYYDKCELGFFDPSGQYDIFGADSIMSITLRLKDDKSKRNFYRLKVRGICDYNSLTRKTFSVTDIFTTDDLLLTDHTLTTSFGSWPAYFTNIFDDHLFKNNEYTITVKTRKRRGDNARVLVEYQEITPDLYYYLRSVYQYRIKNTAVLADPIGIHSNVKDGWGIIGGANASRTIVYYEK